MGCLWSFGRPLICQKVRQLTTSDTQCCHAAFNLVNYLLQVSRPVGKQLVSSSYVTVSFFDDVKCYFLWTNIQLTHSLGGSIVHCMGTEHAITGEWLSYSHRSRWKSYWSVKYHVPKYRVPTGPEKSWKVLNLEFSKCRTWKVLKLDSGPEKVMKTCWILLVT